VLIFDVRRRSTHGLRRLQALGVRRAETRRRGCAGGPRRAGHQPPDLRSPSPLSPLGTSSASVCSPKASRPNMSGNDCAACTATRDRATTSPGAWNPQTSDPGYPHGTSQTRDGPQLPGKLPTELPATSAEALLVQEPSSWASDEDRSRRARPDLRVGSVPPRAWRGHLWTSDGRVHQQFHLATGAQLREPMLDDAAERDRHHPSSGVVVALRHQGDHGTVVVSGCNRSCPVCGAHAGPG
jgi:hypothetical protein